MQQTSSKDFATHCLSIGSFEIVNRKKQTEAFSLKSLHEDQMEVWCTQYFSKSRSTGIFYCFYKWLYHLSKPLSVVFLKSPNSEIAGAITWFSKIFPCLRKTLMLNVFLLRIVVYWPWELHKRSLLPAVDAIICVNRFLAYQGSVNFTYGTRYKNRDSYCACFCPRLSICSSCLFSTPLQTARRQLRAL